MSISLTTTTKFKVYAGITGTSQDALIAALIPQVSDQIALTLGRDLEITTYKSWEDGTGDRLLRLNNWPILMVYQASITSSSVGYIENTSSTVKRASVSFDGTNLTLTEISTTGTEKITELPVATYKILSTLETAVEAVSGWAMVLNSSAYGTEPSSMLRPIYAQDALDATADLCLPDDSDSVKIVSEDVIELASGGSFPCGLANIFCWYKAGYTLPTDSVTGTLPDGLLLLTHQILQDVLSSTKFNSNLQSESIGGYSYSLRSGIEGAVLSAVSNRAKDLALYGRVTI